MFTDIEEAIHYIESKRSRHSVEDYQKIIEKTGITINQKNMIHVAGTNGKGSTVNYLRAVLIAHGFKVATFTSPYLDRHNDRIRIDNVPISDTDLLSYINKYYSLIEKEKLSMFEIDFLIALDYFNHEDIDYRIIECGIGGTRDKTNIFQPIASLITNVGLDHQELLGDTLMDIASNKAGIIKENALFYTTEQNGFILNLFQKECDQKNVRMHVIPEYMIEHMPIHFTFKGLDFYLKNQGVYQVSNARLALYALDDLIHLDPKKTVKAIEEAIWLGRFETIEYEGKKVYIDGAHNIPGIEQLIKTLKVYDINDAVIVFSALKDKNLNYMLALLIEASYPVYLTTFNDERAIDLSDYKHIKEIKILNSYEEAFRLADINNKDIVVTGSLHFISEVRKYLLQHQYKK